MILVAFALFASAACLHARNNPAPVADLGYAKYRGLNDPSSGLNTFYGLRFAEAPVGPLRWKAPKPISPTFNSSNTLIEQNATAPGPTCVQGYPYWFNPDPGVPTGSEDCLLLNVIQPANVSKHAKLPVAVTIHGGGYTIGDANGVMPYGQLKHSNNGFVSVSIQYRLGAYGFLGSSLFQSQGGDANLGLLDQRLALEWVRKHIGSFGGDPEKIVIMGGSAGGGSVTSQLTMYGGADKPPFRGAIAQFPWWQQHLPEKQLETQFKYVLGAASCASLDCLRGLDEEALKNATKNSYALGYTKGDYGYGSFYYGPYVDGTIIQDLPSREFKSGRFAKVPVLVDHALYEGASFTNFSLNTTTEEIRDFRIQFPDADEDFEEKVESLYPAGTYNSTFWRRAAWFGDFSINCPTYYIASSVAAQDLTVYKSVFSAGLQTHSAIFFFLADLIDSPGYNATIASAVKDWYTSFAIHLDPNAESWSNVSKPIWPRYNEGAEVMTMNYTQIGAVPDIYYDDTEKCRFLWENGVVVQN
ncbi:Alpha/Beta hydrolase protein [Dendryphion nanum]|uniref:Carboxylic ester hydrolase n=1 Tax=Dendryphion nanum TaxID=256645 RepID=A0A9P9IYU3_9PLEO|nr:Alpha/Beta hydrolase protein [Dendryphion nanum]